MEDAVQTVMAQCELWADRSELEENSPAVPRFSPAG